MNQIYITSTNEYKPLSHKDTYLYDSYSQIFAFLKTLGLNKEHLQSFSKPVISGSRIEWYSDHVGPMKPITELNELKRREIENSYKEFIKLIKAKVNYLKQSNESENHSWAELLGDVFSLKNNQLISNGINWSLIWGWDFRNEIVFLDPIIPLDDNSLSSDKKTEDYKQPIIPIEPIEKKESATIPQPPVKDEISDTILSEKIPDDTKNPDSTINLQKKYRKNYISFLEWIKRFFRWISYRFWGLMLLILFALIICCICRKCSVKKTNCNDVENIEHKLDSLNQKIKIRCKNR
jgi:hypothetical protein